MPQTILVPGQGPVEFPDGMSDGDIVSAIKKMTAPVADQIANDPISQGAKANLDPRAAARRDTFLPLEGKNIIDEGAYKAGGAVTDVTGSPFLGAAANVALQTVGPPGGMGAKIGTELATPIGRRMAEMLMQKAIRPTPADVSSGKAQRAISTMLDQGYNPTMGGIESMTKRALDNDAKVADIVSKANGDVNLYDVGSRIQPVLGKYAMDPTKYAENSKAVNDVYSALVNHPLAYNGSVPVQLAQKMKQMEYAKLGDSAYGLGLKPAAERDAIKAGARGFKEEIENVVPDVAPINADTREIINARKVAMRRAVQEANNNPISLGTSIAAATHNPQLALGMWANSSALAKATMARLINEAAKPPISGTVGRGTAMAAMLAADNEGQ